MRRRPETRLLRGSPGTTVISRGRPRYGAPISNPGRRYLISLIAILAAVVLPLLIAALLHRQPPQPAGSVRPDSAGLARLSVQLTPMVARRVELIRGLRFKTLPRPRVISAARFRRLTLREAGNGRAQRRLVAAGTVEAKMLGLLSPDADTSSLSGDTSELAAAAYDTKTKRLYIIRGAVPRSRDLAEFVLAHELTHALEDQNFGLSERESSSDDGALARLALTEGTATAVMTEYARRYLDPLALAGSAAGLDTSTHGVPDFIVEQLSFAYLRGAAFVQALYGVLDNWKLVNLAITRLPPASSRQIIHPGDYLHYQRPVPVRIRAPRDRRSGESTPARWASSRPASCCGSASPARSPARRRTAGPGTATSSGSAAGFRPAATARAPAGPTACWRSAGASRTGAGRRRSPRPLRGYLEDGLGGTAAGGGPARPGPGGCREGGRRSGGRRSRSPWSSPAGRARPAGSPDEGTSCEDGPVTRSQKLLSAFFTFAGVMHFVGPREYGAMMPPSFPAHRESVVVSGVAEIVGAAAVTSPATRRFGRWWLLGVLAAVYPANIHMAVHREQIRGLEKVPAWALWARLPLQPLMMWWVWRATKPTE